MEASNSALRNLRGLAEARRARGDNSLVLNPVAEAQERYEVPDEHEGIPDQGLVLEPEPGAAFALRDLARRKRNVEIVAFCDGIRSTYPLGYEGDYPLYYTRNAAAVRTRDASTGYHQRFQNINRGQSTMLAPFGLFPTQIRGAYQRLGLYTARLSDLYTPDEEEYGLTPLDIDRMGSLAWQGRSMRRARRLLDYSEQVVAVAGAVVLREQDPVGSGWLLKDGSLFQFDKRFLRPAQQLHRVVSCVKTHPVLFFGVEGERQVVELEVGQRSVAFLPRPLREAQRTPPTTLDDTARPMVSWYLRVRKRDFKNANRLNGVVRLDIAATDDWQLWVDEVSWAVLDEFYGLSAMPDPRYDVMPFGIYECEEALKSQQIPAKLLLAQLG